MKKICRCIIPLLLALLMLPITAYAAGSIDKTRDVTLTISYQDQDTPLTGAEFRIYLVATVAETGELTVTEAFKQFHVDIRGKNDAAWRDLASTLEGYVLRDGVTATDSGTTGRDGKLSFPTGSKKLTQGLYLVLGQRHTQGGYRYDAAPFMVMLPSLDAEKNEWSYAVSVTPKYDRSGVPSGSSTVTRKVLKVWDDAGNKELRPQEVVVQLLRDGAVYDTVTLNAENNWRHTWTGLKDRYTWTVVEKELKDYTVTVAREGTTFVVTNTYAPDEPEEPDEPEPPDEPQKPDEPQTPDEPGRPETGIVTRTVLKVWDDEGYESKRPRSVQVTLLQNGTTYDTQTLSETNGWQYTWDGLPRSDKNGKEISWTIREAAVSGYASSVRQNGGTFVLTNTPEKQKLPQTGVLWWPVPVLVCGGLGFLIVGTLSRRKEDHE